MRRFQDYLIEYAASAVFQNLSKESASLLSWVCPDSDTAF